MKRIKPKRTYYFSEEAYGILNEYTTFGFKSKSDFITTAVKQMVLNEQFETLTNNLVNQFSESIKNQYINTLTTFKEILIKSNLTLLKNRNVFFNDFLELNSNKLDFQDKLTKYHEDAVVEIKTSDKTIEKLVNNYGKNR